MKMQLEHIAINVPDPVAMADWYVEHCDMKVVLQIDEPPFTRFLADQQGETCIEIYKNTVAPIPNYTTQSHFIYHHAFAVEDLLHTKETLLEAGATYVEEIEQPNGTILIMLRDPWGVPLQLVHRTNKWY